MLVWCVLLYLLISILVFELKHLCMKKILVDLGASLVLLGAGIIAINPVSVGLVVLGGTVYGIYRLAAGEKADAWLNENFGFNNKKK